MSSNIQPDDTYTIVLQNESGKGVPSSLSSRSFAEWSNHTLLCWITLMH